MSQGRPAHRGPFGLEVSEEPISERRDLLRSVQLGHSACFSSSGWTMSVPYLLHTQMAKVELERLSGNSYARAKLLTMSRVIAA